MQATQCRRRRRGGARQVNQWVETTVTMRIEIALAINAFLLIVLPIQRTSSQSCTEAFETIPDYSGLTSSRHAMIEICIMQAQVNKKI